MAYYAQNFTYYVFEQCSKITHYAKYYAHNYCNYIIHNLTILNDYFSIIRLQVVVFYIVLCCIVFIFDVSCSEIACASFCTMLAWLLYHKSFIKIVYIKVVISMSTNWLIMTLINYTDHFVVTFLNTSYLLIMLTLCLFNNLWCSKLCWHNRPGPNVGIQWHWYSQPLDTSYRLTKLMLLII